ncbi:hypothetical protein F2Q69_00046391 [Brassica cretica]|uniref:Replication factor A C-terminal domain-containing protein n=1 Tax=Brassica cretica TaxID=69181 RepID=A0A8S9PV93_BRACR|nr:hypothetical protein F2Q69_00046391 [Brassica cretica]
MATKMQIQTSKGPNDQSVVFGDLKPWKNTWLVHVKVLHAWKQYIQSVETMEFVLVDETPRNSILKLTKKLEWLLCCSGLLSLGDLEENCKYAFDASQMMINPSIPEAEAFKEFLEDSQDDNNKQVDQLEKRGQRDKWLLFPTKSIQEMITSTQVHRCLVRCTVYAIDMDWSWYYFGCKACKRVIKTGTKVKKLNGKEITTHIWWCETCKDSVFDVSPRFWLHLMVSDDTGVSKIMILDKVANGIVAESPEKLLNGSWDELEDPTLIPDCVTDLIGKNFTFGVYVEKENVAYGSEIYKVGKIYKERMTCVSDAITNCQSDKHLAITSGDEDSIYLNESQGTADVLSTPSSKRKEDKTIEQGDLSSTSKKPCTRSIKIRDGGRG